MGKDNDEFNKVVAKVIECYKKVLNSGMALDACRVQGKLRAMILADPEYIKETRAIRAEKYFQELDEVEEIRKKANSLDMDDGGRGGAQSVKDAVTLQLKAAQMRRDLLQLSSESSKDDESDALNFFFCPVSREEMEKMKRVEVFYGADDNDAVYASLIEDTSPAPEKEDDTEEVNNIEETLDDGSDEAHQSHFERAEKYPECSVLHHGVNMGKGRALKDGFVKALCDWPDAVGAITIDGDGQHLTEDIIACGNRMLTEEKNVILGCRDFDLPGVPPRSVAGNKTTSRMFRLYGITRLSGRIYELRQDGHDIRGEKCTSVNRYGKRVYYDLYVLGGES